MQIRVKAFETNSSSTHSLSLSETEEYNENPFPGVIDFLLIEPGEFGWEVETYDTPMEKCSYVYTNIMGNTEYPGFKYDSDFAEYIGDNYLYYKDGKLQIEGDGELPDVSNITIPKLELLSRVIENYTGLVPRFTTLQHSRYVDFGYVDHQSADLLDDYFTEELLKNVLFATDSVIETDNDNH